MERGRERLDTRRKAVGALLQCVGRHVRRFAGPSDVPLAQEYPGGAMRRILFICLSAAVLLLPAATASAGARGHGAAGFVVVRKAAGDGGVHGHPVVTVVVKGFVLGRVTQEARLDVYQLPSAAGGGAPQAAGADVSHRPVHWRNFTGTEFSGSGFRFRAMGGTYRVVVRGAGIYLFVGGHGSITLHGSTVYPGADGAYSIGGGTFRSLPSQQLKHTIGGG